MSVVFAVRGDATAARYSKDGKTPGVVGTVTTEADAGAIGGNRLNLYQGAIGTRGLHYIGRKNMPTGRAISVLMRVAFPATGSPATNTGLWSYGGDQGIGAALGQYGFARLSFLTTGALTLSAVDEANTTAISNVTVKSGFNPTSGQYYDLVWVWDGTTTANKFLFYVDGTASTTSNATASMPSTRTLELCQSIKLGPSNVGTTGIYINEFVIFDTAIDPTSVTLESGSGSLNGSSRTSFVAASVFDGSIYNGALVASGLIL